MVRSKALVTAVVLAVIINVVGIIMTIPILAAGSQGLPPQPGQEALGGPPFFIGIVFLALAVAGLFGAYGLWLNQKWGKLVTIVVCVISFLFGLGDFIGAPSLAFRLFIFAFLVACAAVVFLVLRPEPRALPA